MDAEGVTPAAFEAACRHASGRAVVLSPTLQNPTTASMSLARRERIVAIARRHDAIIVEEDVWLAPYRRAAAARHARPERVCYVTGLSKTVAPGLRIGYLMLPSRLRERLAEAEHRTSWYVSPLAATIAARWLSDGTAQKRLARQRRELAARHEIVRERLAGLDWHGGPYCPHVWLNLQRRQADELAERAAPAAWRSCREVSSQSRAWPGLKRSGSRSALRRTASNSRSASPSLTSMLAD